MVRTILNVLASHCPICVVTETSQISGWHRSRDPCRERSGRSRWRRCRGRGWVIAEAFVVCIELLVQYQGWNSLVGITGDCDTDPHFWTIRGKPFRAIRKAGVGVLEVLSHVQVGEQVASEHDGTDTIVSGRSRCTGMATGHTIVKGGIATLRFCGYSLLVILRRERYINEAHVGAGEYAIATNRDLF